MELLTEKITGKNDRNIKMVQFGEGNFLRGFVDHMVDVANEQGIFNGDIVMIKPRRGGDLTRFCDQDCKFTVSLRGITDGEAKVTDRIVSSVADVVAAHEEYEKFLELAETESLRFVVSNTTEAGIVYDETDRFTDAPAASFPGKLTQFLYHRYETFHGDRDKGLAMLPVELIDDNGAVLRECVLKMAANWKLPEGFAAWVESACVFASTLVDRIITGYPKNDEEKEWKRLGYIDKCLVMGEPYGLWIIESDRDLSEELPLAKAGLPVVFTEDLKPYKQRKVRILNGAHTSFVLASFLAGNDYVGQSMEDDTVRDFMMHTIFDEVVPTLSLPEEELKEFAEAVITRFRNPYVKHALLDIALNSVAKWRARCMPSLLAYAEKYGALPSHMTFSLAALMAFYGAVGKRADGTLYGLRGEEEYRISDDAAVMEFFLGSRDRDACELTQAFLGREDFFGRNLNDIPGLTEAVGMYLTDIRENGMRAALCRIS